MCIVNINLISTGGGGIPRFALDKCRAPYIGNRDSAKPRKDALGTWRTETALRPVAARSDGEGGTSARDSPVLSGKRNDRGKPLSISLRFHAGQALCEREKRERDLFSQKSSISTIAGCLNCGVRP